MIGGLETLPTPRSTRLHVSRPRTKARQLAEGDRLVEACLPVQENQADASPPADASLLVEGNLEVEESLFLQAVNVTSNIPGDTLSAVVKVATVEGASVSHETLSVMNPNQPLPIQNRLLSFNIAIASVQEGAAKAPDDDTIEGEAIRSLHILGHPWRPLKTRSLPKTHLKHSGG